VTAADALAQSAAPTIDTLTWDDACTIGERAWEDAEQSKWILGDIGAIVAHKWQGKDTIKNFANSIGMHDNAKRLYDYVGVATHYPREVRERFPNTTWSAFRECSRHGLTLEQSIDALAKHGDKPVAAIRRAIIGTVRPAARAQRVEFEVTYYASLNQIKVNLHDEFMRTLHDHPSAKLVLDVTWTEGEATA